MEPAHVKIVPIGKIPEDVVSQISAGASRLFRLKSSVTGAVAEIKGAYNPLRKQYDVEKVIEALRSRFDSFLAITTSDVYAENLAFTFGNTIGKTGMISLHRLDPAFYGKEHDANALRNRAVKKALHELGHIAGMDNCTIPGCIMNHLNSAGELDNQPKMLCYSCQLKMPV